MCDDDPECRHGDDDEPAPPGNCDCCTLCVTVSCGLPEYTCPGYCGARGTTGHFKDNAPDRQYPNEDVPERRWDYKRSTEVTSVGEGVR